MKFISILFFLTAIVIFPPEAKAAPGDILWQETYSTNPGQDRDQANSVASGPGGVVAVAGFASEPAGNFDYLTVLYGPKGNLLWARRYDRSWNDVGKAAVFDGNGNLFVAGASNNLDNPRNTYSHSYYTDYRVIKYSRDGDLLMEASAPGRLNNNRPSGIVVDRYGNIFVTGFAMNASGTYPLYYTVRFNKHGEIAWEDFEDVRTPSQATGIALDQDSNVLVTGWYKEFGTGQFGIRTFLYNPEDGRTLWQEDYKPQLDSVKAYAVTSDDDGNIIITGETGAENGTTLTLKYSPKRQLLWASKFTGSEYKNKGSAVAVDRKGRIYVVGRTFKNGQDGDWLLLVYGKDGKLLFSGTYHFGQEGFASSIALEPGGDLLIAGTVQLPAEAGLPTAGGPVLPPQFMVIRVEGWQSLDRPFGEFFNPNTPMRLRKEPVGLLRHVELKAKRLEPGNPKSPIKVTAEPVAGLGRYEYQFFISSGDKWKPIDGYGPFNDVVLPAKEGPGMKAMVQVRKVGSPLHYEAERELDISDVY
ncbi:MAG: hypothetical protein ACYDFU_01985 [Nitrospirota bacterium]